MSSRSSKNTTPATGDLKVTEETARIESPVIDPKGGTEPVNLETKSLDAEPVKPAEAPNPDIIQTDVRKKLSKRSDQEDVFVPTTPIALEKAAAAVATDCGFELNRGTSIGARLMARAQKRV